MSEEYTYKEDVSLFTKILSEETDKLLSNENIDRETCPYCRKFAKKLSGLVSEINRTIYYVDIDNSSDNELKSFREKYNLENGQYAKVESNCCDAISEQTNLLSELKFRNTKVNELIGDIISALSTGINDLDIKIGDLNKQINNLYNKL